MHPLSGPSALLHLWSEDMGRPACFRNIAIQGSTRETRDRIPIPQSRGEWGKPSNSWNLGLGKETWRERSWDAGSWVTINGSEFGTGGRDKGYYGGLQTLAWHFPRKLENLKRLIGGPRTKETYSHISVNPRIVPLETHKRRLANFFPKGPDNKYFLPCGP